MKSLEATLSRLAVHGAVLHLLTATRRVYLVGELSWLGPCQLFWFTAHGDRADDGHVLGFDAVRVAPHAVTFLRERAPIARLTRIEEAEVDDTEDYAVAFSLWRQVAPARRHLIEQARAARLADLEESGRARASAVPQPSPVEGALETVDAATAEPEFASVLREVAHGAISVRTALSLLTMNGAHPERAARWIFEALGGGDQTEIGPDGRARYAGSGLLVAEVERKITAGLAVLADVR